jgi:hypothetical protein
MNSSKQKIFSNMQYHSFNIKTLNLIDQVSEVERERERVHY